ncbi:LysR family transcriptional regulator [Mycoavidus sp. HKI]|uniref:LysR family transcriptional regulator n=1 Tax=Mycoavidus sp. HKI TaxID=2840467 RepID=UPI001CC0FBBE|nr:LysR family transcriptional regulator [Mycoavidus sp. HKI]UAW63868.1 LysR family transcriptional regulator [Mycoavidus sp. HKI]
MKEINQRRLRYFHEVYTCGKIRGAAANLNTDTSVVTRQIRLLEEEVGAKLFERRPRGVAPTEAAELLQKYYQVCYTLRQNLETGLQELRGMKRGMINIIVLKAYSEILVEDVLHDFCKERSGLNICIKEASTADQIVAAVVADEAHMGIMSHYSLNEPNIKYSLRVPLPICLVVSCNHPLASQKKVTFLEAARYPLALPSAASNLWSVIREAERSENVQLAPVFVSDSISSRKKFSSIGEGGTFMSALAARQEIKAGQLVALEVDHPSFKSFQFCLAVKQSKPFPPAVNQLLRVLEAKLLVCAHAAKDLSVH